MYGLLGKKLGHSYSKVIHEQMLVDKYELISLDEKDLDIFLKEKQFDFVNVTIPYKQTVIPYLNEIDDSAKKIGAVNLIVNKCGKLTGYNTDYYGFLKLVKKSKIDVLNKNCLILGTGGTSKTAHAVLDYLQAKSITHVSRKSGDSVITYQSLTDEERAKYQVIINTTPVGMYPNIDETPITLDGFVNLEGVIDVIYNPVRTKLIQEAIQKNLLAVSGLEMLIYQAVQAEEIFFNQTISENLIDNIYYGILSEKLNIVLIGMPGVGKTTIGKMLQDELRRELIDIDTEIEKKVNMSIPEIFDNYSEEYFRMLEKEVIKEVALKNNAIISTGGGAILNYCNVENLKTNGILIHLNRNLDNIMINNNRPLTKSKDELLKLAEKRMPLYDNAKDIKISELDISDKKQAVAYIKNKIDIFLKGEMK